MNRFKRKFRDTFGPITPIYKRSSGKVKAKMPGMVTSAKEHENPRRLLLSAHRGLVWYFLDSGKMQVLNENNGIYYGVIPSPNPERIYVVSSRLNVRSFRPDQSDSLLEIDEMTGEILSRKGIPSSFTHDCVLAPDRSRVFVADTSTGAIHVLLFPSLELSQRVHLFSRAQHINTLAPTDDGKLWVMLHNRGDSDMVLVDYKSKTKQCTVSGVGKMAHGIVKLDTEHRPGHESFLILSSRDTKLVVVTVPANCQGVVSGASSRQVLWEYQPSTPEQNDMFLKGLVVVDQVAYFGLSRFEQTRLGRLRSKVALVAFDLATQKELWIRQNVGIFGLINVIGVPHLGTTHTYRMNSFSRANQSAIVADSREQRVEEGSACSQKYVAALEESKTVGTAFGTTGDENLFIELPLRFDVKPLVKELHDLEAHTRWTHRPDVNNYFILLVTKHGIQTDQSNEGPFKPVKGRLENMPYTRKVLSSFESMVGRSRYMNLTANTNLIDHVDRTYHVARNRPNRIAGYWGRRFRVHIPLVSDDKVTFGGKTKRSAGMYI